MSISFRGRFPKRISLEAIKRARFPRTEIPLPLNRVSAMNVSIFSAVVSIFGQRPTQRRKRHEKKGPSIMSIPSTLAEYIKYFTIVSNDIHTCCWSSKGARCSLKSVCREGKDSYAFETAAFHFCHGSCLRRFIPNEAKRTASRSQSVSNLGWTWLSDTCPRSIIRFYTNYSERRRTVEKFNENIFIPWDFLDTAYCIRTKKKKKKLRSLKWISEISYWKTILIHLINWILQIGYPIVLIGEKL